MLLTASLNELIGMICAYPHRWQDATTQSQFDYFKEEDRQEVVETSNAVHRSLFLLGTTAAKPLKAIAWSPDDSEPSSLLWRISAG